jgi:lipopolysaccharide transport system ATP-binding protein
MNKSLSVSVDNLSKRYMLYEKPRDRLKHSLFRHFGKTYGHEFWALHDIHFELHKGETLGVIGRNGSGKSTLLQIIAGTLTATTGEVKANGRVAALLELGSGFNPEYTGRENAFLNGAILGISRKEMESRMEEIIAFADIGEFIDQPVKSYSSGMFVRLAFAVTTGLDAEILLIDEALAVGDVFFTQKCYGRLEHLRKQGVSIILVSHSMTDVEQFCQRAILLHHGMAVHQGPAPEVVNKYYLIAQDERLFKPAAQPRYPSPVDAGVPKANSVPSDFWPSAEAFYNISQISQISNNWARCTGVALCDSHGQPSRAFRQGEAAYFYYEFEILKDMEVPIGGIVLQNEKGIIVHGKNTLQYGTTVPTWVPQGGRLRFQQKICLEIAIGDYTVEVGLAALSRHDYDRCGTFSHAELDAKIVRICHLAPVGEFAVIFRDQWDQMQLLHHGIANLSGQCTVYSIPAPSSPVMPESS